MIEAADLTGVEDTLALRVIAVARSFAPNLDALEGGDRTSAVAILRGVAFDARSRGSRHVKSQRIGPAAVEYAVDGSWFTADDRAALRALGSGSSSARSPIGRFPKAGSIARIWPEQFDDE